jgi:UDP-N-acetylglucosamine 2-epimerase
MVLKELHSRKEVDLQIIVACSANIDRYGDIATELDKEELPITTICRSAVMGDDTEAMAITTGLLVNEISPIFDMLLPDLVIAHADRYETLGIALAASYMNIPVAHTQGGEHTGSIDDKVRHAVSMLADIHFL